MNTELIYRLAPSKMNFGSLLLHNSSGFLFEYDIKKMELQRKEFDVYFSCGLFSIIQFKKSTTLETIISFENGDSVCVNSLFHLSSYSIFYRMENLFIKLYDENSSHILLNKNEMNDYLNLSEEICYLEESKIESYNLWCVYLNKKKIVIHDRIIEFDDIVYISSNGIIFSKEEENYNDMFFLPFNEGKIYYLYFGRGTLINAHMDSKSKKIILVTGINGEHEVYESFPPYRNWNAVKINGKKKFGTVTPITMNGKSALFITGALEGIFLYLMEENEIIEIIKPKVNLIRSYDEGSHIKVTSLLSNKNSKLDVLFFHGGPESSEWDNPRFPMIINRLSNIGIDFHIINYAGSKGYGKKYRTLVDKKILTGTVTPIINWINENLTNKRLILIGGSFGATLAIEIYINKNKIHSDIDIICITNPLVDLNQHINKSRKNGYDITFFKRKFSDQDIESINIDRYKKEILKSDTKFIFLVGRHDEVITPRPIIRLIKSLKNNNVIIKLKADDGRHADLMSSINREKYIVDFILGAIGVL
ncbi:hypothetical protein FE392_06515 [Xenorhabdus sp. 12]|uniref:Peptidase S9 prolyl oligopeptidase catalytic domain-containing protein n=1 Tax=Xenorhabdus santafensis TaxID=2582833 RepID=A0ABU4S889_9GAMM|nr:prolyl oligopeptidase family serine peptidase [Xenorhabdus sp. 12]MDX7986985.1 hypothetical protein [Xenorhabdus sp. 12]